MPDPILPDVNVEVGLVSSNPVQVSTSLVLGDATWGQIGTGTLGTSTTWTDISNDVNSFVITRPSTREQGPLWTYQSGTQSCVLDNSDGAPYDPDNIAGPYYGQLAPMVPVRTVATFAGVNYYLYSGFSDGWFPGEVTQDSDYVELTLTATDAFKVLSNITLAELGSATGINADTGARVKDILSRAGWYTSAERRVIDVGNSNLQGTTLGADALSLMQIAADSEIGQLYVNGNGAVVFRARRALLTDARSNTVQAVFGDSGYSATDTTYDQLIAAATPLAWWQLDETAGSSTAADSSGNSRNATATGMAFGNSNQAIPGNNSASLLASNSPAILSSYNPSFASGLTVEAWVNLNFQSQGSNNPRLVTNSHTDTDHNGFQLMVTNSNQAQFWVGNGTTAANATGGTVPAYGWTHLVGTYDGSNVRVYVNGVQVGFNPLTGTVPAGSASGIGLGYNPAYNGDYLSGLLAECSVYSGAISAATVLTRYQTAPVHAELAIAALSRSIDDTTIVNDVQAQNNGGTLQEVTDATSISQYKFPRVYPRTDLILQNDSDALNWAQWVLYVGKNSENRFESIKINPQSDPYSLWPQVLGRDIGDRIQVWHRPATGIVITKDCFITGITHEWNSADQSWMTTWTLQDASKYGSFLTLGNPTLGQIGSNALVF